MLSVLDRKWREHLYEMDYLREGIYLRAYSQRDPLVEYQREGFDMFAAMMDGIKEEAVGFLFNLEVQRRGGGRGRGRGGRVEPRPCAPRPQPVRRRPPRRREAPHIQPGHEGRDDGRKQAEHSAVRASAQRRRRARPRSAAMTAVHNADDPYAGVGRNAECPCGSGKKYKKCHGAPGGPTGLTARSTAEHGRTRLARRAHATRARACRRRRPLEADGEGAGALAVADVGADLGDVARPGSRCGRRSTLGAHRLHPALAGPSRATARATSWARRARSS